MNPLSLLGSLCALSLAGSLACAGGYGAEETPDTDTTAAPRNVARAAETPAPDATEAAPDWSAPIAAPVVQPAAVPATTPAPGNQPAAHADAGPAPVASDPVPPSSGDAGPAPVGTPLVGDDQFTDERGAAGCESGYSTFCERAPCTDAEIDASNVAVCRAVLPTDLPQRSPCHADESCASGYCLLTGVSTRSYPGVAGSCQPGPPPAHDYDPNARCHWYDQICITAAQ